MNTNQPRTTKSTQELKDQVMNDLKRVKDDFEEIKQRMTPGQLIDDAIYYRRGGGNPAATFDFLKQNPVGTSFLTLGTLLLMEGSDHVSMEQKGRTIIKDTGVKYGDRIKEYKTKAHDLKQKVGDKIDDLRSGAEDLKIKYGEAVDTVENTLNQAKDSISSAETEGVSAARSKFSAMKGAIADRSSEALETVKNLDPMTYMVLGAGLGTITGAALPVSDVEDRMMSGEVQDKFNKFRSELEVALNESANILKNELIGGVTDFNIKLF